LYVEGIWAVKSSIKERGEEEGGQNGFDEHEDFIKQYKGTQKIKPQQPWNNNTKSPKQSCKHILLHVWL
jgi:hypothetical protein